MLNLVTLCECGKDPLKPYILFTRRFVPGTEDPAKTSLRPMAIQLRRAAESLGYDPNSLTEGQRTEIISSLMDRRRQSLLRLNI